MLFFWQLTVKQVLNPKMEEVEFYNTIIPFTDVILRRGEGVDVMEVDKDDLEEVEAATSFVEKAGVFDKALDIESPQSTERTPPQALEPSMPNATFDKLVSDVAELKANQMEMTDSHMYIKANQIEIKAKLDLVLQLEQKLLDLFQVFSQKKDKQEKHSVSS